MSPTFQHKPFLKLCFIKLSFVQVENFRSYLCHIFIDEDWIPCNFILFQPLDPSIKLRLITVQILDEFLKFFFSHYCTFLFSVFLSILHFLILSYVSAVVQLLFLFGCFPNWRFTFGISCESGLCQNRCFLLLRRFLAFLRHLRNLILWVNWSSLLIIRAHDLCETLIYQTRVPIIKFKQRLDLYFAWEYCWPFLLSISLLLPTSWKSTLSIYWGRRIVVCLGNCKNFLS